MQDVVIGQEYGFWTIVESVNKDPGKKKRAKCRCRCGTISVLYMHNLIKPKCAMRAGCSAKSRQNRVARTCLCCGTSFDVKASEVEKGSGKYCSRRCQGLGSSSTRHQTKLQNRRKSISEPYWFENELVVSVFLTQNKHAIIDACDANSVEHYLWKYNKGYGERTGSRGDVIRHRSLHRAVLDAPDDKEVDHINGNGLDNRRKNLRVANRQENCQNIHTGNGVSGIRGVHWLKNRRKWRAGLKLNGKNYNFGQYDTVEEAEKVISAKRKELMPFSSV